VSDSIVDLWVNKGDPEAVCGALTEPDGFYTLSPDVVTCEVCKESELFQERLEDPSARVRTVAEAEAQMMGQFPQFVPDLDKLHSRDVEVIGRIDGLRERIDALADLVSFQPTVNDVIALLPTFSEADLLRLMSATVSCLQSSSTSGVATVTVYLLFGARRLTVTFETSVASTMSDVRKHVLAFAERDWAVQHDEEAPKELLEVDSWEVVARKGAEDYKPVQLQATIADLDGFEVAIRHLEQVTLNLKVVHPDSGKPFSAAFGCSPVDSLYDVRMKVLGAVQDSWDVTIDPMDFNYFTDDGKILMVMGGYKGAKAASYSRTSLVLRQKEEDKDGSE